jgi:hypothetical protein
MSDFRFDFLSGISSVLHGLLDRFLRYALLLRFVLDFVILTAGDFRTVLGAASRCGCHDSLLSFDIEKTGMESGSSTA